MTTLGFAKKLRKEMTDSDAQRTAWLNEQGFKALRFWNNEVLENLAGVLEVIVRECSPSPPAPLLYALQGARWGEGSVEME